MKTFKQHLTELSKSTLGSYIIPVLAVNRWLGRYFFGHIGGYTGDCLGASQQIAETVFYLSVSALWTFI